MATDIIIHDKKDNVGVVVIEKITPKQDCSCWIMVIFAGDFNIAPDEKLFAYLSNSLQVELPDLAPPLYATANFADQDLFPAEGEPVWIDYIFLKTTARAKQKSTWIERIFSKNWDRLSDHDMIYSVFEMKGNNNELYD